MTETTRSGTVKIVKTQRALLSKVPEVTVWFWIIKILCTTVGESFADWINTTLGVGLIDDRADLHHRACGGSGLAVAP